MDLSQTDYYSNRRSSNCSFSTFSINSNKDLTISDEANENKPNLKFFTTTEPNNTTRKFSPQIIISANSMQTAARMKTKRSKKSTLNRADCIRKRIKTHFNQYLIKTLNRKINMIFPYLSLCKLSQKFIADVKIESNKQYISQPVRDVFTTDFAETKSTLNNKSVVDVITSSENTELKALISRTYGEFFSDYLKSESFFSDVKKFMKKEGENYSLLYRKYAFELVEYYKNCNPYKKKMCFFSKKLS